MQKSWKRIVATVFILSCILFCTQSLAEASAGLTGADAGNVSDGAWKWTGAVTATEISKEKITTPNVSWRQLLSDGLSISGPARICHPFRGGLFGWTGEIYELKGDSWRKLETTTEWVPDEEGEYMACAYAPEAGTYALFGAYHAPDTDKVCGKYWLTRLDAEMTPDGGYLFYGTIYPNNENVLVSYKFSNIKPDPSVIWGATSASTYTGAGGDFYFTDPVYIDLENVTGFTQKFYIDGCPLSFKL